MFRPAHRGGYALGATGGHCDSTVPAFDHRAFAPDRHTPDEFRALVRKVRDGAEVIKICATGGSFPRPIRSAPSR
jgi:hypothetical protein